MTKKDEYVTGEPVHLSIVLDVDTIRKIKLSQAKSGQSQQHQIHTVINAFYDLEKTIKDQAKLIGLLLEKFEENRELNTQVGAVNEEK